VVDGQWRIEQLARFAPGIEYGTAPFPPFDAEDEFGGLTSGNHLVIPANAAEKEGAWEFIKFWSGVDNPERAAEFYTWGGWLPIRPAIADAPVYEAYLAEYPQYRTFVKLLNSDRIEPTPPVPYQQYLIDRLNAACDRCTSGGMTPEQALDWLNVQMQRELERRKELGYATP
jgi:ABC-type glycerol-3-phosphate transport system substrate-binding protein